MEYRRRTEALQHMGETEQQDQQDFIFLTVKETAERILRAGRTTDQVTAMISETLSFANYALETFEAQDNTLVPVACKAGCHYCCFYQVWLTPPEVLLIGHHVDATYSDQDKAALINRIRLTLDRTEGRTTEERAQIRRETPCIFLSAGRCSVYPFRPIICRAFHALNRDQCRQSFESNDRTAQIDGHAHRYHVFRVLKKALANVCSDLGFQMEATPIAKSMEQYFGHPDPVGAWFKGEELFYNSRPLRFKRPGAAFRH